MIPIIRHRLAIRSRSPGRGERSDAVLRTAMPGDDADASCLVSA
jgi:hypothetical protein